MTAGRWQFYFITLLFHKSRERPMVVREGQKGRACGKD